MVVCNAVRLTMGCYAEAPSFHAHDAHMNTHRCGPQYRITRDDRECPHRSTWMEVSKLEGCPVGSHGLIGTSRYSFATDRQRHAETPQLCRVSFKVSLRPAPLSRPCAAVPAPLSLRWLPIAVSLRRCPCPAVRNAVLLRCNHLVGHVARAVLSARLAATAGETHGCTTAHPPHERPTTLGGLVVRSRSIL